MLPDKPLSFAPVFRSYLWGGDRLRTRLKKSVPNSGRWAESWEVVDHGKDQSVVSSGPWKDWTLRQLIESFPEEILGSKHAKRYKCFPLLLKYLDCNSVLSVQVHPDDQYASRMVPPDLGKTEAWYIVDAEEGAVLYAGLESGVTKADLAEAIKANKTEDCLHKIYPKAGDCVFIPAGTIHALGSGLMVAEIQQASDTTFRLFDWNRVDVDGNSRPLHIDQALEVINFELGPIELDTQSQRTTTNNLTALVHCDKFCLQVLHHGHHELTLADSFRILTVPEGTVTVNCCDQVYHLAVGQTLLLPAASVAATVAVQPESKLLVAGLPD